MKVEEVKDFILNLDLSIKKIVLSDRLSGDVSKIVLRPVEIKGQHLFQEETFKGTQAFHRNLSFHEAITSVDFKNFKQVLAECEGKTIIFSISKNGFKKKEQANNLTTSSISTSHNKAKKYLLSEGEDVPIMQELGIFTKDNKIVASMYDKFKQINRFIEIIDDEFKSTNLKEITILDFGCGKSYLTFLIYHYFVNIKHIKAHIIGYDIKKDVVENCNKLAKKYNYSNLEFILSDVKKDKLFTGKIDMVITLHACDTATDYALNFAIQHKAKYIFSVPCCQHEINLSIRKGGEFDLMLKDGIVKERFCALLTDEIRAEILRAFGYKVDMIEFVDFAHSPKNIMIRAKLNSSKKDNKIFENIENLIKNYNFSQKLYDLTKKL